MSETCEHDTDGDGDCQHCHKHGGCRSRARQVLLVGGQNDGKRVMVDVQKRPHISILAIKPVNSFSLTAMVDAEIYAYERLHNGLGVFVGPDIREKRRDPDDMLNAILNRLIENYRPTQP